MIKSHFNTFEGGLYLGGGGEGGGLILDVNFCLQVGGLKVGGVGGLVSSSYGISPFRFLYKMTLNAVNI